MVTSVLNDTTAKMTGAIEALKRELAGIRTGRASPALVERLQVQYYGTPTPLNQLANISASEARLLVIQPWDKSSIVHIEKAILASELGLNPSNDGNVIRLNFPPLPEERRRELVKLAHRRVEEARVEIRNHRRDALNDLKERQQQKVVSEDEGKRGQEEIQKLTDRYIVEADRVGELKEKEILEV